MFTCCNTSTISVILCKSWRQMEKWRYTSSHSNLVTSWGSDKLHFLAALTPGNMPTSYTNLISGVIVLNGKHASCFPSAFDVYKYMYCTLNVTPAHLYMETESKMLTPFRTSCRNHVSSLAARSSVRPSVRCCGSCAVSLRYARSCCFCVP
jgi:hypothetical protein